MGSAEATQRKLHYVLVVRVIPDWGNTRLRDTYTFNSYPSLAHCNLVACLHSTIRAVTGLAEMNEARAGRHILPFVTTVFFVHKTNGENQWKQMAQGNGRKETDLPRTYNTEESCKVEHRGGNTGHFSDFNWLCDWSDEEKIRVLNTGLKTGFLWLCPSLCTSQANWNKTGFCFVFRVNFFVIPTKLLCLFTSPVLCPRCDKL